MAEGGRQMSAADCSAEEEEFLPGFTSLEDYSKVFDDHELGYMMRVTSVSVHCCALSNCTALCRLCWVM